MNRKISVFVICVEAIINLLLCNLHDWTFNFNSHNANKKPTKKDIPMINRYSNYQM